MLRRFGIEPGEPLTEKAEAFEVDLVELVAALSFLEEQTCLDEHSEVTRRRGPGVVEAAGDVARGHRATQMDGEQNLAPRGVGDRGTDRFECRELGFGLQAQASGSSVVSVMVSRCGPIVSHTAITAGIWCALSAAFSSRH